MTTSAERGAASMEQFGGIERPKPSAAEVAETKAGVTAGETAFGFGSARIATHRADLPDCMPGGIELVNMDGGTHRAGPFFSRLLGLFRLPRRNRYRLGRLGNALVRSGALRRAA